MAFKLFDIDKNKLIDQNEFEIIIKLIYDLNGYNDNFSNIEAIKKTKTIIDKFGTFINTISYSQDKIIFKFSFFSYIDKNYDGFISEEEFIDGCLGDQELRILLAPCSV
jgi:hypothetical protein